MDYIKLLTLELQNLEETLKAFPDTLTIKSIKGKYYLYEQSYIDKKIICTYKGIASDEYVRLYNMKNTYKLISWLLKNKNNFMEGLKLLSVLKNKYYPQSNALNA